MIIIDELGFGYIRNDAGATFYPAGVGAAGPWAWRPARSPDLRYARSALLVAGDVLIVNALEGQNDVIRFNPAGTGGPGYPASVLFYSETPTDLISRATHLARRDGFTRIK